MLLSGGGVGVKEVLPALSHPYSACRIRICNTSSISSSHLLNRSKHGTGSRTNLAS